MAIHEHKTVRRQSVAARARPSVKKKIAKSTSLKKRSSFRF